MPLNKETKPNHFLDSIIWLYLFMQVSLFSCGDYLVEVLFHHDWRSFGSLLEANSQLLLSELHNPVWLHSVRVSIGLIVKTYIHQLCVDTWCRLEDLRGAMTNKDRCSPVSLGWRIHQLHLYLVVRFPQRVF